MSLFPSLLVNTLSLLNKQQQKRLLRFADSPLHNTREDVRRLLACLCQTALKNDETEVFALVFETEDYSQKQARYVQNYTFSVLKDFLAWQAHDTHGWSGLSYLQDLIQPGADEIFMHLYKEVWADLQKQPLRNAQYHNVQSQLLEWSHEVRLQHNRSLTSELLESYRQATIAFVADRLRQACAILLLDQMQGRDDGFELLEAVLELSHRPDLQNITAVRVYYSAFLAIRSHSDDAPLHDLLAIIPSLTGQFSPSESKGIILMGINCCIRRINSGRMTFLEDVLRLYEIGLEQEVFFEGGYLSRFTYNNIIVAALRLKRYEWAEKFASEYMERIEPQYKLGASCYNLALIAYQQGRHNEALDLLQRIGKDDKLHQIDAKRMLIRIYFDLNEYNALESLLDSFKLYLYRQRHLGYHRQHYINLIRFVKALIRIKPGDKIARAQLKKQIEECKALAERQWLMEVLV